VAWFSEVDLRVAAGPKAFARGRKIVDAVSSLHTTADGVRAVVHGTSEYAVFLGPASPGLIGECDCPVGADGTFCKHCVAVGLAMLGQGSPEDLREHLRALAEPTPQITALSRQLEASLSVRGSVDHAGSVEYASIADDVLDVVEQLISSGHAAEARALARRAVERITESLLLIDDTSGVVGAACQRALTLYARGCTAARPNSAKLAGWLFRLQLHSPGWPTVKLSDFADALGDAGMSAYRTLLADAWEARSAAEGDIRPALTLLLMRERLAKLDGDPNALEIAERLPNPALFLSVAGGETTQWLVEFLVQAYLDCGRTQDALELRRSQLAAQPTRDQFARLKDTASTVDRWAEVRPWALDELHAAADRHGFGDALVGALLDDTEPDEAWLAAEKYGCAAQLWLEVARHRRVNHPTDVLPGYRTLIDERAAHTGRRHYREVVNLLRELRSAADAGGQLPAFRAFVGDLRARHRRKSALLDELDRAQLDNRTWS
jgi:hypothetical protein